MSSADEFSMNLEQHGALLLDVARRSIAHGVEHRRPLDIDAADHPPELQEERACFVTLRKHGELRGCMGCLEASQSLLEGVAYYAFQAAFHDPRFPGVKARELEALHISLSILSRPTTIEAAAEADLLLQLQPGIDGVILTEGSRQSTLLPQVWEHLDNPRLFVAHLKRKAGLPENYWSPTLRFRRYRAESISEPHVMVG